MGLEIDRDEFDESQYERFAERLDDSLGVLRTVLGWPGFGEGPATIGAELEVALVDDRGRPLPINREVLAGTLDPRMTFELERFNLECNLRYGPLAGRPFAALTGEFESALGELRRSATRHGARVAVVGIVPTLREEDFRPESMTESMRYRALAAGLRRLRREPFRLHIQGEDSLETASNDVTFEGANTSLQVHLRVAPGPFARLYNALQLATAPVLAVAANAPTFMARRLWDETRVALFKQSVDDRGPGRRSDEARVSFGRGWIDGAHDLFAENVALHEPLLPVLDDEDPAEVARGGGVPRLRELRLHQGTVWRWNRAIYDPSEGGHLRVEMRALPAGPTVADMVANTAFLVGLAQGLAADPGWRPHFPFEHAHRNFYRAARRGPDAELAWPAGSGVVARRAGDLVVDLLDVAAEGLRSAGVDAADADPHLHCIAERARTGQTGARWQREALARLEPALGRAGGLEAMFVAYMQRSEAGEPVHAWPLPDALAPR